MSLAEARHLDRGLQAGSILDVRRNSWWNEPLRPFSTLQSAADRFDARNDVKTLRTSEGQPIKVEIDEATGDWNVLFLFGDYTVKAIDLSNGQINLKAKLEEVCKKPLGKDMIIVTISLLKNGSQVNVLGLKSKDAS